MKLIREWIEEVDPITETLADGSKQLYIEGIFLQSDMINRNGRMYPFELLQREVARYNANFVNPGRAFGELGHPDTPAINLERVSHRIVSLAEDGKNFVGRAIILNTAMGNIARGIMEGGGRIAVSSRGVGSLKERAGTKYVQDDFQLSTAADIVYDPSAPDAFVRGIMEEQDWIIDSAGNWSKADIEKAQKFIKESSSADLEEKKMRVFEAFIQKLRSHK